MVFPRTLAVRPNSSEHARLARWMPAVFVEQQQPFDHAVEQGFLLGLDLVGGAFLGFLELFNRGARGFLRAPERAPPPAACTIPAARAADARTIRMDHTTRSNR